MPSMEEEEARLLRAVLDDDATAWRGLVGRYAPLLHAVVRRTFSRYGGVTTVQDEEDAVAAVWRNLLEHDRHLIRRCLERGNLAATLHVLARHRAVDLLRRHRPEVVALSEQHSRIEEPAEEQMPAEPHQLHEALERLTERQRTVVRLFYLQGKRYREIAEVTGMPANSVGPTLTRALRKLRESLDAPNGEPTTAGDR